MAAYARRWDHDGALDVMDWFCGAGGSSQGAHAVPGVRVALAANHWPQAIETHAKNFPDVSHFIGDIRTAPVWTWPVCKIFWASPECPQWSVARGAVRDFDKTLQGSLFDDAELMGEEKAATREEAERSRALMEEVPLYLRSVQERGKLVLAGVVENVIDVRAWDQWDRWLAEFHKLGYRTRLVALNSMHANPRATLWAPQSRDRLYLVYWHKSIGRTPDFRKWLSPKAWCQTCDKEVLAVQRFKNPTKDMGRYRSQYEYRCPHKKCGSRIVEPLVLPAAAAIDWSVLGTKIGDRETVGLKPLADKTVARIVAGMKKHARPITLEAAGHTFERRPGVRTRPIDQPLTAQTTTATKAVAYPPQIVPAGGTWRNESSPISDPMPARTTRENDALIVPPLVIPCEGRQGKEAASVENPLRTQTARAESGLAYLPFEPFQITMRGGGSQEASRPLTEATGTVSANGNHLAYATPGDWPAMMMRNNGSKGDGGEHCTPVGEPARTLTTTGHQSLVDWRDLLVPYYGNGQASSVADPIGALSTRDRYALVSGEEFDFDIDDVRFRMLQPEEIGRAMSFAHDYEVLGNKRQRVRQYGNAVTPNAAEVLVCLLVECITGVEMERYLTPGDLTMAA
ncbi:DNA cytosine methyltransferase [Streptomyces sp. NPDC003011]